MKDKKLIKDTLLKIFPVLPEIILILVAAIFLPRDLALILYFALGIAAGITLVALWWYDRGDTLGIVFLYLFGALGAFAIVLMNFAFDYTMIDGILLFLLIALAGSLPIAFLTVMLWFKKARSRPDYEKRKKRQAKYGGVESRFAVFFVAFLIAAGILLVSFLHMNYLFDFHEGQGVTATVLDKRHSHSYRGKSSHTFLVEIDGEQIELEVGGDYDEYEIGDTYTFYRYEGAFDIAFYLPNQKDT